MSDELAHLYKVVGDMQRRLAGGQRAGVVHAVDAAKGVARLRLGGTDADPYLGPWIPYGQVAGALKVHSPPSVGQQMWQHAPGGEYRQGKLEPFTWSDQNASPSTSPSDHVITLGGAKVEFRAGEIVVTIPKVKLVCGGSTFELTDAGLQLHATDVAVTGDTLTHGGKNVGKDHKHIEVVHGGDLSGVPQ